VKEVVAKRAGRPSGSTAVPREHILATAARLFSARGYQATTVRDIAREVGIQSGSLFHHFSSKEQMLVEMVREAAISMCVGAEALIAPISAPDERLRALVRFELDCFVGPRTRDFYAVLVSEWRDVPPSVQIELRGVRQRYARLVRGVLDACHRDGLLRDKPDACAMVLHGVNMSAVTWFRQSGSYTVDHFAGIVAGLLLVDAAR
jgi:AcrR family transcriptional regulator